MTEWIHDLIEDRRKIYKSAGRRSPVWTRIKVKVRRAVKKRRNAYNKFVLGKLENDKISRNFYQQVNGLLGVNDKPRWSPVDMFDKKSESDVVEILAAYFNSIINEYAPLAMEDIPRKFHRALPELSVTDVANKIKKS